MAKNHIYKNSVVVDMLSPANPVRRQMDRATGLKHRIFRYDHQPDPRTASARTRQVRQLRNLPASVSDVSDDWIRKAESAGTDCPAASDGER